MAELDGKVAIVTGGASGIGRAIVERFVAEGARVVIADVDNDAGHALAKELGDAATFHRTDVTDAEQVQGAIDLAGSQFGALDAMVNNAGIASQMVRFLHDDLADFDKVMNVNVKGVLIGCQLAARAMKERGGSIINTSSTAGIDAGAGLIPYRASKAAVIHVSRSIALDVAQYGIRVNCIVPGQVQTAMTTYDMDTVMKFTQPLPTRTVADDVANAAVFLASDRSKQVTGITLPVDGGTTAGPPAGQLKLMLAPSKDQT
jgi:NAD(P)-dependent dehydrogenase (short-subunit alcohol dehydrogenase family)